MFLFWGLLAPKPLGVFRYRLLGYACTKNRGRVEIEQSYADIVFFFSLSSLLNSCSLS